MTDDLATQVDDYVDGLLVGSDPILETVVGGGLGGWQSEAFILCPKTLHLVEDPPVGAPALYRELTAWRDQMAGEGPA